MTYKEAYKKLNKKAGISDALKAVGKSAMKAPKLEIATLLRSGALRKAPAKGLSALERNTWAKTFEALKKGRTAQADMNSLLDAIKKEKLGSEGWRKLVNDLKAVPNTFEAGAGKIQVTQRKPDGTFSELYRTISTPDKETSKNILKQFIDKLKR